MKGLDRSEELFEQARKYMPGGVNSPVRAFKAVGGTPPVIVKGAGSRLYDADGNTYIDYICSWGALILGHAHPQITRALKKALERGTSFGAVSKLEIELAKIICEAMPSIQKVRFVSSGTEATMSAIRLARAYTGRNKIIKFEGGYHGHGDTLLAKSGSGVITFSLPDSPGVTQGCTEDTLVAPYNSISMVEKYFQIYPRDIAALIVEPVSANMGVVLPIRDFLKKLRELSSEYGALLIFDEVITGFRLAYGGAQEVYQIQPDLTCLGKIIGGGLPVGAYGGRKEIMQMIAPEGAVYQAGTLSGNPLTMTAGIETLRLLKDGKIYAELEKKAGALEQGIVSVIKQNNITARVSRIASLLTLFFTAGEVTDHTSAKMTDTQAFARFFHKMLQAGIYWPPSQFEACFISAAHTNADIRKTIRAIEDAVRR